MGSGQKLLTSDAGGSQLRVLVLTQGSALSCTLAQQENSSFLLQDSSSHCGKRCPCCTQGVTHLLHQPFSEGRHIFWVFHPIKTISVMGHGFDLLYVAVLLAPGGAQQITRSTQRQERYLQSETDTRTIVSAFSIWTLTEKLWEL